MLLPFALMRHWVSRWLSDIQPGNSELSVRVPAWCSALYLRYGWVSGRVVRLVISIHCATGFESLMSSNAGCADGQSERPSQSDAGRRRGAG